MLRERTLQHLLLSVARSLEEAPENESSFAKLRAACETLQVVRQRQGPFEVSVSVAEGRKITIADTGRFRFHERGDVPSQVQLRRELPDARTYNWEQAVQLWEELLEIRLVRTRGLAPARVRASKDRKRNIWLLLTAAFIVLLTQYLTKQVAPTCIFLAWIVPLTKPKKEHLVIAIVTGLISWVFSGFENPILGLILIMVSLHVEHLGNSTLAPLALVVGSLLVSVLDVNATPLIPIVMSLELVVSLAQKNYQRLLIVVCSLTVGIFSSFLAIRAESMVSHQLLASAVFVLAVFVVVAVFPYSAELNLLRVSAPIGLAVSTLFLGTEAYVALVFLTVWLFRVLYRRNPEVVEVGKFASSGTPVSLRKR
jgi:hypothetical protein